MAKKHEVHKQKQHEVGWGEGRGGTSIFNEPN